VTDNGRGITPSSASGTAGNGLANIRARAEELGGLCTIQPGATNGTVITWHVPT